MIDDYAAEPERTTPLAARTLLIDADSGRRIHSFNECMPADPGARIELGPPFHPPGTEAIVMKSRITDADGEESVLVLK